MTTKTTKRVKLNVHVPSDIQQKFEQNLGCRVIGQPNGVALAARARARAENPLRNKRRPIYVALLLGPTSVGKTETVREAAFLTHGDADAFIQVNAAAYKEKHRISQLIGAPPGYVGYKDGSDPREEDRKKKGLKDKSAKLSKENLIASRKGSKVPITYVLVDELEKAGEDFFDLLLSIFEDGVIDFGNNDEADFREVVFFLTGNVGAYELSRLGKRIGFTLTQVVQKDIQSTVEGAMKEVFKPEFLARIDEVCVYNKLSKDDLLAIVGTEISRLKDRLLDLPRGSYFELKVDALAEKFLLTRALVNGDNARDIRRICDKLLTDALGNELMKDSIPVGSLVEVTHEAGSDDLSFFLTEGVGQVSAADLLGAGYGKNNQTGVPLQRGIERAQYAMKKGTVAIDRYTIQVPSEQSGPMEEALALLGDIRRVFGLEIVKWSVSLKPSYVEAEVLMTAAFEPLIKKVYKTATIKLIDRDSVSAAQ